MSNQNALNKQLILSGKELKKRLVEGRLSNQQLDDPKIRQAVQRYSQSQYEKMLKRNK